MLNSFLTNQLLFGWPTFSAQCNKAGANWVPSLFYAVSVEYRGCFGVEETIALTKDSTSLSVVGVPSPGSFTLCGALDSMSAVNKDFPGT